MNVSQWPTTHSSIFRGAGQGEQEAWRRLDDGYRQAIVRYATARGLSAGDAEDVAQEVFSHLFDQLSRHRFHYDRQRGRFRGWLARVIRQRVWRLRQPDQKFSADRVDSVTIAEIARSKDWNDDLEQLIRNAVEQLQGEVSDSDWHVFDLYWHQRLPPREIATVTPWTSAQVAKIVFRCRNRLLAIVRSKEL